MYSLNPVSSKPTQWQSVSRSPTVLVALNLVLGSLDRRPPRQEHWKYTVTYFHSLLSSFLFFSPSLCLRSIRASVFRLFLVCDLNLVQTP